MKLQTIQTKDKLNDIYRDWTCHTWYSNYWKYKICPHKKNKLIAKIVFQHGDRGEDDSVDGVRECDLLEIVRDRLSYPKTTIERQYALQHVTEALMWLAQDREKNIESCYDY